jgi:hypothetical protein
MDSALDAFKVMMRDEIGPALHSLGFRGSGQRFEMPSKSHWVLVGFQKSDSSNRRAVKFTLNLTVADRDAWAKARKERSYLPDRPSPNIRYGSFVWQTRIGKLLPDGGDRWWVIAEGQDVRPVALEVAEIMRLYGLPWIQSILSGSVT